MQCIIPLDDATRCEKDGLSLSIIGATLEEQSAFQCSFKTEQGKTEGDDVHVSDRSLLLYFIPEPLLL